MRDKHTSSLSSNTAECFFVGTPLSMIVALSNTCCADKLSPLNCISIVAAERKREEEEGHIMMN